MADVPMPRAFLSKGRSPLLKASIFANGSLGQLGQYLAGTLDQIVFNAQNFAEIVDMVELAYLPAALRTARRWVCNSKPL